jgi:uncharacterized protein YecA (UPF0149 family)
MTSESADEEMRFFSGVDNEPFTEDLERELLDKGWKAADLAVAREEGAMYNRRRNSAVFPLEYDLPDTPARSAPPVGRNENCPCGSGKKYKKCCGVAAE